MLLTIIGIIFILWWVVSTIDIAYNTYRIEHKWNFYLIIYNIAEKLGLL